MTKSLSGLTIESLNNFLTRVREISGLGDEDAITETDKLIYEVLEGNFEIDEDISTSSIHHQIAQDSIQEIRQHMKELKERLDAQLEISNWDANELRRDSDMLSSDWPGYIQKDFFDEVQQISKEAYELAERAEKKAYMQEIEKTRLHPIHNISSVRSIIRRLDTVAQYFTSYHILTDDIKQAIRASKERAAWSRASKKLDSAQVVQAGGNQDKANNLKKEATVLLAQDWELVFPGEEPPTIPMNLDQ